MSGNNGHAHVAAEMREPPLRQIRAAEMSSQRRNAMLDEMVRVVNTNARAMAELRRLVESQGRTLAEFQGIQDAHADWHLAQDTRTLLQRLRASIAWLFAGGW